MNKNNLKHKKLIQIEQQTNNNLTSLGDFDSHRQHVNIKHEPLQEFVTSIEP